MKKWLLLPTLLPALLMASPVVVFDFGGVMAHPDRSVVVQFLCKSFFIDKWGLEEAQADIRSHVQPGTSLTTAWCEYATRRGIDLPERWPRDFEEIQELAIGSDPNMYALVEELKAEGVQVALFSNVDRRYALLIRLFNLYDPFDPVLLSYEIGVDKPDPKAYRILLQRLGRPPQEVIFIDDKPENVEAARAVGINAILFESPEQVREVLQEQDLLAGVNAP